MPHFKAGATVSAGQMNTIAHQGIQLIEERVLEVDQLTVTFSGIPQSYQTLWLVASAGVTNGSLRSIIVRFNGDNGSNYVSQRTNFFGDDLKSTDYVDGTSVIELGVAHTDVLMQSSIYIPAYSRTDRNKSLLSHFAAPATIGASSCIGMCGGEWKSTAAITELEVMEDPRSDSVVDPMLAGSIFTLYGLGATSA